MKKVLVTGASGFIGQYVVQELLERNCAVIATSARPDRIQSRSWFQRVDYIPLDLQTVEPEVDYFEFFGSPDHMIHLAWEGLPNYKEDFHLKQNLPGHFLFLSNMLFNGLRDLTVTGTCFEYGMKEGALSEDMPAEPANAYSKAKDQLRRRLEELKLAEDFQLKWVRLFYMYGEGQHPNSILGQLKKAIENNDPVFNMSGGEQVRDYLPVEQVASHIVSIALQDRVEGIINCCSGNPITIRQLVDSYIETKKANIKLNPGYYPYPDYEPMRFWGNPAKLKSILEK